MLREGRYVGSPKFPSRIGIEASGIIEEVGNNVTQWKVGDEICAIPFLSWNNNDYWTSDSIEKYGTYGDTAIVPAWTITKKIEHHSFEEAAASWCRRSGVFRRSLFLAFGLFEILKPPEGWTWWNPNFQKPGIKKIRALEAWTSWIPGFRRLAFHEIPAFLATGFWTLVKILNSGGANDRLCGERLTHE